MALNNEVFIGSVKQAMDKTKIVGEYNKNSLLALSIYLKAIAYCDKQYLAGNTEYATNKKILQDKVDKLKHSCKEICDYRGQLQSFSTGTFIINGCHWYLPSTGEALAMYTNLFLEGVGDLSNGLYWTSTEMAFNINFPTASSEQAYALITASGEVHLQGKNNPVTFYTRPITDFVSSNIYNLRDVGLNGGLIFYIETLGSGQYKYYEAAPNDIAPLQWGGYLTLTNATGTAIGTGKENTKLILGVLESLGETNRSAQSCCTYTYTEAIPEIEITGFTLTSETSRTLLGNVISVGSNPIIEYGFIYNTTGNPSLDNITDTKISLGSKTSSGTFETLFENMEIGVVYYFKAYAYNSIGLDYSSEVVLSIEETVYGNLYNFYAVDTDKLAPIDYRVPSSTDFSTLCTYLGGEDTCGGSLKSVGTLDWYAPNLGALDTYGFKAIPTGSRLYTGYFSNRGELLSLWTSTSVNTEFASSKSLFYDAITFNGNYGLNKHVGANVRIMRDATVDEQLLLDGTVIETIQDFEGQNYTIIKLGTQAWATRDLKSAYYNDGEAIPNITGILEWYEDTTGAYCEYV